MWLTAHFALWGPFRLTFCLGRPVQFALGRPFWGRECEDILPPLKLCLESPVRLPFGAQFGLPFRRPFRFVLVHFALGRPVSLSYNGREFAWGGRGFLDILPSLKQWLESRFVLPLWGHFVCPLEAVSVLHGIARRGNLMTRRWETGSD